MIISGCIFVFLAASWTSPVFPFAYGYDSSWYSLMGRAITEGHVPYRDYFDLKGPVFFFIEAIGQFFLKGRPGIVLIECIANAASAIFIWKTARLYLKRRYCAAILAVYYFIYFFLLWGGNTCEEYMTAFNFACIYLALDYLKKISETDTFTGYETAAFVFGFSFGVIALSKVTVAAPMLAAALTVMIGLIRKKQAKLLLPIIGLFLAGAAFIVVPVCAYFALNHAFDRFIYCAFTFAFMRSTDYYETFSLEWEKNLTICYVVFIFSAFIWKNVNKKLRYFREFLIIVSAFTFLALHLGTPYTYYFITELTVFVPFLMVFFRLADDAAEGRAPECEEEEESRASAGTESASVKAGAEAPGEAVAEAAAASGEQAVTEAAAASGERAVTETAAASGEEAVAETAAAFGERAPSAAAVRKRLKRLLLAEAGVLIVLGFYWKPVIDKMAENVRLHRYPSRDYYDASLEVRAMIPPEDQYRVYNLESGMIYYEMIQELPTNQYPVNLPYFLHLDPSIKADVMDYLTHRRPTWIISEDMESFDDDDVKAYVFSHYVLVADTEAEELYRSVE